MEQSSKFQCLFFSEFQNHNNLYVKKKRKNQQK